MRNIPRELPFARLKALAKGAAIVRRDWRGLSVGGPSRNEGFYQTQQWRSPLYQSGARTISDPEPEMVGPCGSRGPSGKVLVLAEDGASFLDGVSPNLCVIRIAQSDFDDV